ncbi:MAG: Rieske (2Fe-2S) protein [Acidobacteriota bacterium]
MKTQDLFGEAVELNSDNGAAGLDAESRVSRRRFCHRLVLTSTGLALAANSLKGESKIQHSSLLAYPPMKIEGAERVLPGSFLYFNYPKSSDPAILVRSREGEFLAYSRKCAHLGCSVDFDSARRCLSCPCHRGTYDARTGYVIYGPPPRPLDQIALQMRAGAEVWAVGKRVGTNDSRAGKR